MADREERPAIGSGPEAPSGRRDRGHLVATVLALGLIGLWVALWVASIRQDRLAVGKLTWVYPLKFLAGDFKVHIDHVARIQALGIDPYRKADDWVCALYPYPPMIGRLFVWVTLFDTDTAACLWQGALAVILSTGAWVAWRTRRELGIGPIPLAVIIVAALYNSPALFAVERGQADPLVILPMIAATWLLRRRGAWSDVSAGALLGATAWVKYYPGLAVVALIALGRRKAVAAFIAVAALIGVVDLDGFRESVKHAKLTQVLATGPVRWVNDMNHSLVENWGLLRPVRHSHMLRQVPPAIAAAVLLLPAVVLVSRKVARSADPSPLIYPYLLWRTAATTFGMPASNDYNLTALPIATLAVWDRRDRPAVHIALGLSLLWSQPFALPVTGQVLLYFKLGALYAVGACLAARATSGTFPGRMSHAADRYQPAFARVDRQHREAGTVIGGPAPGSRSSRATP